MKRPAPEPMGVPRSGVVPPPIQGERMNHRTAEAPIRRPLRDLALLAGLALEFVIALTVLS